MSNKDILLTKIGILKSALGNKRLKLEELPYMYMLQQAKNKTYIGAYTETIDVHAHLEMSAKFVGQGNFDYKFFDHAVRNLSGDISIRNYRKDKGLLLSDGESNVVLNNFITQEKINPKADIERISAYVSEKGKEFSIKNYVDTLTYLRKVSNETPDGTTFHSGMLYMGEQEALLLGINYFLRVSYMSVIPHVISTDEGAVILKFLQANMHEDKAVIAYNEEKSELYFKTGESYLVVYNVSTSIPSRPNELFRLFTPTTEITLPTSQFLRYLNLASAFLPTDIDEISCIVRGGKGVIERDNKSIGSSKGSFDATGCPDFHIRFKIFDVQRILQNQIVDDTEIKLKIRLDDDTAYFEHPLGDAFLSISVESYDESAVI